MEAGARFDYDAATAPLIYNKDVVKITVSTPCCAKTILITVPAMISALAAKMSWGEMVGLFFV
ncbi:MAG: hypothetical protein IPJ38_23340 [Dechloromonas sp.]|uniref:Uncharacterized protein n=1 Tax=Candidatus Dechloromonas phosphorivorans TaxID=2899244 RepID=A0A935K6J7_9RHOO|nr:hypothetical protein [Candidatus Dechloromonas phosphorivorans]